MDAIDKIRELLKGSSLSRKEILSHLSDIEEKYNVVRDEVNANTDSLVKLDQEANNLADELEKAKQKILKGDNLLEQELVDEFTKRFKDYQQGLLDPNLILQNYKAI